MLILQALQFLLVDPAENEDVAQKQRLTAALSSAVSPDDLPFIDWSAPTRSDVIFPRLFRTALRQHLESMPSLFPEGIEVFFKKIQEARHSIHHPRSSKGSPPYSNVEIYSMNERLRFIIRAEVLAQLGFNAERIKLLMERKSSAYLHLSAEATTSPYELICSLNDSPPYHRPTSQFTISYHPVSRFMFHVSRFRRPSTCTRHPFCTLHFALCIPSRSAFPIAARPNIRAIRAIRGPFPPPWDLFVFIGVHLWVIYPSRPRA